jgi:hypothetical protein
MAISASHAAGKGFEWAALSGFNWERIFSLLRANKALFNCKKSTAWRVLFYPAEVK